MNMHPESCAGTITSKHCNFHVTSMTISPPPPLVVVWGPKSLLIMKCVEAGEIRKQKCNGVSVHVDYE